MSLVLGLARKQALINITQVLSETENLQVTFSGGDAYTDGKRINIPAMPDEAWSDLGLFVRARGYSYHEVGHCLYTDFDVFDRLQGTDLFDIVNLFEDIRIERSMAQRYRGAAESMEELINQLYPQLDQESIWTAVGVEGRRQVCGYDIDALSYKQALEDIAPGLIAEIGGLDSTEDALRLAKKYKDLFKNPPQSGSKQQGTPSASSGNGQGAEAQDAEASGNTDPNGRKSQAQKAAESQQGDGKDQKGSADKQGDKKAEAKPGQGDSQGKDGQDQSKGQDADKQGKGQQSCQGKDGNQSCGKDQTESKDEPGKRGAEPEFNEWCGSFSGGVKNDNNAVQIAAEQIAEAARIARAAGEYIVYSEGYDRVELVKEGPTILFDELKDALGPLNVHRQRIVNLFQTKTAARWRQNIPAGRVNSRRLAGLRTGNLNVFKTKVKSDEIDTAVTFLIDCSGSMQGAKVYRAMQAAVFFLETLAYSKVSCEVLGYTTLGLRIPGAPATLGGGMDYARLECLRHYIFKNFDEPYSGTVRRRLAGYQHMRMGRNGDVCSIRWALSRLAPRKEHRKVLVVLCDGLPNVAGNRATQYDTLKKMNKEVHERSGIELVGIGIGKDISQFYPNCINIKNNDNIAEVIMGQIRRILAV